MKTKELIDKKEKKHPCTCPGCDCGKDCIGDCKNKKNFNKRS